MDATCDISTVLFFHSFKLICLCRPCHKFWKVSRGRKTLESDISIVSIEVVVMLSSQYSFRDLSFKKHSKCCKMLTKFCNKYMCVHVYNTFNIIYLTGYNCQKPLKGLFLFFFFFFQYSYPLITPQVTSQSSLDFQNHQSKDWKLLWIV